MYFELWLKFLSSFVYYSAIFLLKKLWRAVVCVCKTNAEGNTCRLTSSIVVSRLKMYTSSVIFIDDFQPYSAFHFRIVFTETQPIAGRGVENLKMRTSAMIKRYKYMYIHLVREKILCLSLVVQARGCSRCWARSHRYSTSFVID